MIAPRSGAAPLNPSVIFGITAPEFFGAVPGLGIGVKAVASGTGVRLSVPSVIVVVHGCGSVMLSFCIRRVLPPKSAVVFASPLCAEARLPKLPPHWICRSGYQELFVQSIGSWPVLSSQI